MGKKKSQSSEPSIIFNGPIDQGPGSTIGHNNSIGQNVTTNMGLDLSNPVSLVLAAANRITAVWWGIGVAAIIALVAIASRWGVPPLGMVLGTIGLFIGMIALYAFASLLNPPPADRKPPLTSMIMLWSLLILFIASGACAFSSFFFDRPLPLKSMLLPRAGPTKADLLRSEVLNRLGRIQDCISRAGDAIAPFRASAANSSANTINLIRELSRQLQREGSVAAILYAGRAGFDPQRLASVDAQFANETLAERDLPSLVAEWYELKSGTKVPDVWWTKFWGEGLKFGVSLRVAEAPIRWTSGRGRSNRDEHSDPPVDEIARTADSIVNTWKASYTQMSGCDLPRALRNDQVLKQQPIAAHIGNPATMFSEPSSFQAFGRMAHARLVSRLQQ